LARYLLRFRDAWGDLEIIWLNGALTMIDPTQPHPQVGMATFQPVSERTFRIDSKGNFGSDGELAKFSVDEKEKNVALRIGNLITFPVDEW
jgi:hypothetical protein